MRTKSLAAILLFSLMLLASAAFSATPRLTPEQDVRAVSDLTGTKVEDAVGREVGEVWDVVIDLETARVTYVIVETAGNWSVNGKYLPIPWSHLETEYWVSRTYQELNFRARAHLRTLRNAPRLLIDFFPIVNQPEWDAVLRLHWQDPRARPTPTPVPSQQNSLVPLPITSLGQNAPGMVVSGRWGLRGEVADLYVAMDAGRVEYVLVEAAGERYPVPVEVLGFNPLLRVMTLPYSQRQIANAPRLPREAPETLPIDLQAELEAYYGLDAD